MSHKGIQRKYRWGRVRGGSSLLIGLALIAAACSGTGDAVTSTSGVETSEPTDDTASSVDRELRSIVFGYGAPVMDASLAFIPVAQEMGYFADEGLNVILQMTAGSAEATSAVLSGALDVGAAIPAPVMQAIGQEEELLMVYNMLPRTDSALGVLEQSPIEDWEDLSGTIIGVSSLGTGEIPYTNAVLRQEGLDPDTDVEYLAVGTGAAALTALEEGQVDSLALWYSQFANMENAGAQLRYLLADLAAQLISAPLIVTPDFLAQNPDVVEGMGLALAKATVFTAENPEAAVRITWETYPQVLQSDLSEEQQLEYDLNLLDWRFRSLLAGDPVEGQSLGVFVPENMDVLYEFSLEAELIESAIDIHQVYTNQFAEAYNDFDFEAVKAAAQGWE